MKTVLSTKEFARVIKKAIDLKCETFEFKPSTNELIFSKIPEVCIELHNVKDVGNDIEKYTFDSWQMYKVCKFITKLPEQPIVVEFDQYMDDKLSIELSQFVKPF